MAVSGLLMKTELLGFSFSKSFFLEKLEGFAPLQHVLKSKGTVKQGKTNEQKTESLETKLS